MIIIDVAIGVEARSFCEPLEDGNPPSGDEERSPS